MNLKHPNSDEAVGTTNRSRNVVPMSGLCSRCVDGCKGSCDIWLSSFRGREVLYPGPFGEITAGADKDYPVDYSHLNIQGYAQGAHGLPEGVSGNSDTAVFDDVHLDTAYGWDVKVPMRLPIFTGALGSTDIARKNWEQFAIGAAISGITLVCGENVCGIDPDLKLDSAGKVISSPEMDRRIEIYRRFASGYGELLVQINVEDTRLGTAEYIASKHNLETIEMKWGQGAKCIGGEIKVSSLEMAKKLKERGYIVFPDVSRPDVQASYAAGGIREFERHSRLGFIDKSAFFEECDRLRDIGFKRITLKTGAYSMKELAMALRFSAEAKLDLLTIDGAPGGTGMSPWPMMNEWGIPTFYLQSLAYQMAVDLTKAGFRVPDLAIAGGISDEASAFKALAMGAPYFKAVCMGRSLMIPGMTGKNIERWILDGTLPKTVSKYGSTVEEIFVCYEEVKGIYGDRIRDIPLGAVGMYTYAQRFKTGFQQLMAGSRNFSLPSLSRSDLMALTQEAADVSGIPYVMEAYRDEAWNILLE